MYNPLLVQNPRRQTHGGRNVWPVFRELQKHWHSKGKLDGGLAEKCVSPQKGLLSPLQAIYRYSYQVKVASKPVLCKNVDCMTACAMVTVIIIEY